MNAPWGPRKPRSGPILSKLRGNDKKRRTSAGKKAIGKLRNPEVAMGLILGQDKRRIAPGDVHRRSRKNSFRRRRSSCGSEDLAVKSPDHEAIATFPETNEAVIFVNNLFFISPTCIFLFHQALIFAPAYLGIP